MSLPRYPEYKDSGVAWLGEVPGHWSFSRHKYVASFNKGKNPTELSDECLEGMLPYLSMENLRGGQENSFAFPQSNSVISCDRQVLILWDGSNAGEFVLGKTGIVSSTMAAAQIKGEFDPNYYWFYCQSIETEMRNHSRGMGIPHVNGDELNRIEVPIPPHDEQQTIAAFLDRETGKIDALIAEQRRLVELLAEKRQAVISHAVTKGLNPGARMKDSGIEWLGEVPEHWEVKRIKFVIDSVKAGPFGSTLTKDVYVSTGYRVYGQEQVIPNDFTIGDYFITPEKYEELSQYSVLPGDILISCVGTFGKIAIIPSNIEPGIINPRLIRVRCSDAIKAEYLVEVMRSNVTFEQFTSFTRGGTMDVINIGTLNEIFIVLPPMEEQGALLDFLHCETAKFDILTAEANRAIKLLQERRSALISAAVTGKIDVRSLTQIKEAA